MGDRDKHEMRRIGAMEDTMQKALSSILVISWISVACGGGQVAESAPPTAPAPAPPEAPATAAPTAEPAPPPAPKPTMAEMQESYRKQSAAAWAAHDAKALAKLYADDVEFGYPGMGGWHESKGRASLEKNMGDFFTAFPDAKVTPLRGYHVGDVLVLEWVLNGTQKGEFMGKPPSDKKIGYHGASVIWFGDGGLVKREHMYFDHGTFLGQLGLSPKGTPFRPVEESSADTKTEWVSASGSDTEKKNGEAMTAIYGALEKRDLKAFAEALAEDVGHDNYVRPPGTPNGKLTGRERARRALAAFYQAMPDTKWTTTNMWTAGDYVIVEGTVNATMRGAMGPIKPTFKNGTVHWLDVNRFKDGKNTYSWSYGSSLEFASAFGLGPKQPPKPAAAKAPAKAPPAARPKGP